MESIVFIILNVLGVYLIIGMIFSIFFIWKGAKQIDPMVEGTGFLFRLLLLPASTFLWVFLLYKWVNIKR